MHTDVNECSDGTHTCQQVCDNTRGAFRCMCNSGFALNNDGFSCRGEYILFIFQMVQKFGWCSNHMH